MCWPQALSRGESPRLLATIRHSRTAGKITRRIRRNTGRLNGSNGRRTPTIQIFSILTEDIFGDRLVLGIKNDSGQVFVSCNGFRNNSEKTIPDGQVTVLSLVVQPDAKYKVYANGTEAMDNPNRTSDMTAINPNFSGGRQREIFLGGGSGGWSTFNGNIGDLFVYKLALPDVERQTLEADLKKKFIRE